MTNAPPSNDPFRSPRLIYRSVRFPSDNNLFLAINDDHEGYVNSNASNIKLPSAADAEAFQKVVSEALLGAIICLPPAQVSKSGDNPASEAREDDGAAKGEKVEYGTAIGQIHLKSLPQNLMHHRFAELGISILPAYQGRGYGSEAIRWALDYAFHRAGLHRVNVRAFEWNEKAVKVYEKLGFKHEGRHREELWHEGRWWDGLHLGMLDREWSELQRTKGEERK